MIVLGSEIVEEPMTRPEASNDTLCPDMVTEGEPAVRVIPFTISLSLAIGVKISPAAVILCGAIVSAASYGMEIADVPMTRPVLPKEKSFPPMVVPGEFLLMVAPLTRR